MPIVLVTDHPGPTTDLEAHLPASIDGDSGSQEQEAKQSPSRYEVAEHAIALLLPLAQGTAVYDASARAGNSDISVRMPLHRVAGSVLGVVGFGHIGRAVAARSRGPGMIVLVADRSATQPEVAAHGAELTDLGAELTDLEDLTRRSDAVTPHMPLTNATHHVMDERRLARMLPTAVLINCARGVVVDLEPLTDALAGGRLAGGGIDVFQPERVPVEDQLVGLRNTVLTPHVASYSEESVADLETKATQNVIAILTGTRPTNVVNGVDLS